MAKRAHTAYMTPGEQIAGTVFFVIYLLVLPFAAGPMFRLAAELLGTHLDPGFQNVLYYYILFAVTLVIFHGFLGRTSRHLAEGLGMEPIIEINTGSSAGYLLYAEDQP